MLGHPQKILIRSVNWIGDAVLTIPAIRSIRQAFPDASISLLARPHVSEIFSKSPYINEIILYDDAFRGIRGRLRLAGLLRAKGFDMAILLQNAFDAALISWLSNIPERIGYRRDWRGPLLTKAVPVTEDISRKHQVYYYLNLIESIGIPVADPFPYIHLSDDEIEQARPILSQLNTTSHHPLTVGISPGATYGPAKRWLPARFSELIDRIIEELNGRVVIFGSLSEVKIADDIVKRLKIKGPEIEERVIAMAGRTSLRQLIALISCCDAFVTNDSGPMHIASALLVPTVAIFGSTDSRATGPFGEGHRVIKRDLPCAPCLERECPEGPLRCMTEITTDEVFKGLKEVLPEERAVFLDRDGTLIEDRNYLNNFEELVILPDTEESLQSLKKAGFKLIGVTNQSGIARGIVDEGFIRESNAYLQNTLGIDDFYYCPHHPDDHCPCRKPEPLLLLKARLKHRINLKASYVIGDKESDVLLARRIGATGILLSSTPPNQTSASYVVRNLKEAARIISTSESSRSG